MGGGRKPPPVSRRSRWGWIDFVILALVALAIGYVVWRVDSVLRYRWNWSAVMPFIVRWDAERGWVANLILQGFVTTIRVSIWGAVIAIVVGTAMGIARTSNRLFLRLAARSYVETIRNVPPLVFIFVFYFFVSSQIVPAIGLEAWIRRASPETLQTIEFLFGPPRLAANVIAAIICLGLFEGAYVTEIVRAGIQAVDKGQWEAARSVGLGGVGTLRHVILPQAIQKVVPPLANQFISLVKDSSLVSLVSIQELAFLGSEVANSITRPFEVWIIVSGFYLVLCGALSLAFARLESRMRRGLARVG
jgi:polar amino acid transport system permease protein